MTNAELVREINRMIRGVALNYPDGLKEIRKQLDAVDANPAGREGSTGVKLPPAGEVGQWKPEPSQRVGNWGDPPATQTVEVTVEGTNLLDVRNVTKRKPGRPPGSKNRPKGAA